MPEDDGGEWHETIILPDEILSNSPSRQHGISEEVEFQHRVFGCELIQEAGILLKSPQVVMATGQNLLQRYYYRQPLTNEHSKRFSGDAFSVAMGCLFLACKVEENPRRPRDVIAVFHRMAFRRKGLEPEHLEFTSEAYFQMKNTLFEIERIILKELGFSFYNIMDHPHKFILYYIKVLQGDRDLAQKAWNYLNDSLRLDCCLRYRAELVACAAIYMAARDLRIKLPENPPWWELFGVTFSEIKQVGDKILSLYHQSSALRWLEPLHPRALVSEGEFYRLQKHGTRKEGGGGSMLPPSPIVMSSTPTDDTYGGRGAPKADKGTPETTREGEDDKGGTTTAGGGGGGGGGQPKDGKSPSVESSVAVRALPDKSESRDRATAESSSSASKKHRHRSSRSRTRSRSKSPSGGARRHRHDRDDSRRGRDRSRSRERTHRHHHHHRSKDGRDRRRDRSRSRDRGSRR